MPKQRDFDLIFSELKHIFKPYELKLIVSADTPTYYALETHHIMKNKHRLFFGGVRKGKAYVSFHLMPVYACADVRELISPALKKRMQGKSCFNFSVSDPALYKELAMLTKNGFRKFNSKEVLQNFRVHP